MNKNKYLSAIEDLGLSSQEANVYLAGLFLGPTTVQKIAEVTALERTNIYRIIRQLQDKGLISVKVDGLKKLYVAESPDLLISVLESKQKKFQEVLPGLREMYGSRRFSGEIKFLRGLEGIKTVYAQLMKEIRTKDFYYVISDLEKWHELDNSYFQNFVELRIKKEIHIKSLLQSSERAVYNKKYERNFLQEIKMLPEGTYLETDTIITPNKVIIIQLQEPVTTFVIENESIIGAHKQYFEIMWEQ